MELADILVNKLACWPRDCIAIHQDYDREVWAWEAYGKGPRSLGFFPELARAHRASGEQETLAIMVTEEMYNKAKGVPQDDPLPPAPESALYVNSWGWAVGVRNLGDEVQIGTGDPNNYRYGWTWATLDPDAALQLAHDLTRMAMEIKRRERAQSGE